MVRASASQSVDLGFNRLVESYQKIKKNGIFDLPTKRSAFKGGCGEQACKFACCPLVESYQKIFKNGIFDLPAWPSAFSGGCGDKPASSLVVSLGKALNGTPSALWERQVVHTPRKWQLPSECGLPVQKIAIQFAF